MCSSHSHLSEARKQYKTLYLVLCCAEKLARSCKAFFQAHLLILVYTQVNQIVTMK